MTHKVMAPIASITYKVVGIWQWFGWRFVDRVVVVGCWLVCNFGLLGFFLMGFGNRGGGLGCDHDGWPMGLVGLSESIMR